MDEIFEIVNNVGKVVGQSSRSEVYKKGLLHRAVNIIVVNSGGKIYLQKRGNVDVFPKYWDISAAEHLKTGESYEEAARRGLLEELGIKTKVVKLRDKHPQSASFENNGRNFLENEIVELWCAAYDGEIKIDGVEVVEGRFASLSELKFLNNTSFTPWGLEEIRYILDNPHILDF